MPMEKETVDRWRTLNGFPMTGTWMQPHCYKLMSIIYDNFGDPDRMRQLIYAEIAKHHDKTVAE